MENNYDMYKQIIEQLVGVAITDADGRYIFVNKSWEDMIGYKFEYVKGKFVRDIIKDSKADKVLKTGKFIKGHPIVLKNNGNMKAFSQYTPIFKNNKIIAVFIQVIMMGMEEALLFSDQVNKMSSKLKYYKNELRNVRGSKYTIDNIIGKSDKIEEMKRQIYLAARTKSTVLIEGETGTGKELVAHSIHDLSDRSSEDFIKVNCAAIPKELLESEFFGYEEGSFTGAKRGGNIGKFELANKGTLFLDEINLLDMTLQPKLLRALQEKEIERVGGKDSISIDIRVVVAANKSLEKLVKKKLFREDLFYRLNVIKISIPPLRKRLEDIDLIFDDILSNLNFELSMNITKVDPEIYTNLKKYDWPGNVRELQNVIERAMNISYGKELKWEHFEGYFKNKRNFKGKLNTTNMLIQDKNIDEIKNELEKNIIISALNMNHNNKTKTAEFLGVSRTTLYNKIIKFDIK
ncbi:sigma 54-interacting transcriptional regulator [Senegalia massiliensis]|uniref:PAS domain S-box protein n=1 Tax=Senegalia massiliensis TaxID=1720316 RepID=A0A845QXE0_9CLOT|nr:PAS domain S-box protein [Senegalia massiliensis]